MLLEEEAIEIKRKLIEHIESTFPPEKIDSAKQQVESMTPEQLEKFLEKNNLVKEEIKKEDNGSCVFCSISSDKIKSVKLGENEKAVAVLEINPISKGHTLIIPKEHADNISKEVFNLADKISKNIKKKLMPKKIEMSKSKLFGHEVLNLLPVYGTEDFDAERKNSTFEELQQVLEILEHKIEKIPKKRIEKIKSLWLPKRIP